jgi:Zn-dependent membrane protease YugP
MIVFVLILVVVVFAPSLWVRWVMHAYSEDLDGMPGTGGELAQHLIERFGLESVKVETTEVGDHYDPVDKRVRLSEANFSGRSLTAIAIAAHEVGHAMQDHQNDPRLVIRTKLVPIADKVARFSAGAIWAAPIFALITRHPVPFWVLAACGLGGLLIRMMVHLVTLPIEWDASFGKALPVLKAGSYLGAKQERVVSKILRAAAFTYVAAALADVLNLARWAALLLRR